MVMISEEHECLQTQCTGSLYNSSGYTSMLQFLHKVVYFFSFQYSLLLVFCFQCFQSLTSVFLALTHAQVMQRVPTRLDHSPAHARADTLETDTPAQVSIFCNVSVLVMTAEDSR